MMKISTAYTDYRVFLCISSSLYTSVSCTLQYHVNLSVRVYVCIPVHLKILYISVFLYNLAPPLHLGTPVFPCILGALLSPYTLVFPYISVGVGDLTILHLEDVHCLLFKRIVDTVTFYVLLLTFPNFT